MVGRAWILGLGLIGGIGLASCTGSFGAEDDASETGGDVLDDAAVGAFGNGGVPGETEGAGTPDGGVIDPGPGPSSCTSDADCEDSDPCTSTHCGSEGECEVEIAAGAECDDGDPCTQGEACGDDGACVGGAVLRTPECTGFSPQLCDGLGVGDPCVPGDCCVATAVCEGCEAGEAGCNESGLWCVGTTWACDDGDACTADNCECKDGTPACGSETAPDGTECDADPNLCTTGDTCMAGQCIPGDTLPLDDGNQCTKDLCVKGEVVHEGLVQGQCDDGNECTTNDGCYLGNCVGGDPVVCPLGECVSSASCQSGVGCVTVYMPEGAGCEDGALCTDNDTCTADHVCEGPSSGACDDLNLCTTDACDPISGGCTNTPVPGACFDGNPCTAADTCSDGVCQGTPLDCSYLDSGCTAGLCLNGICVIDTLAGLCDDGDDNTCNDMCLSGVCVGSACQDCAPGMPCDDGNLCTVGDSCIGGQCVAGDVMDCSQYDTGCTVGYCQNGVCIEQTNNGDCDDGDLSTCGDNCESGECEGDPCGETCKGAYDLGDGDTIQIDTCQYEMDYDEGWCGNQGPDVFVKANVNYPQGKLDMVLIQGFPSLVVNYRFFKLLMCEGSIGEGYCYENAAATPGWGGYGADDEVYIMLGSSDGSCGIVELFLSTSPNP